MRQVGSPQWWVEPFQRGWGNPEDGYLYFGVTLANPTDRTISVGVSFTSYEADGTRATGCTAPGGGGPGVTETIAPRETALVTCQRSIVPRTTAGLQVTARLWDIEALPAQTANYETSQATFAAQQSSPMQTIFDASALVTTRDGRDMRARFVFRFYSAEGTQVATCQSDEVVIEPGVALKVSCFVRVVIDAKRPQPVAVRAEPLAR